MTTVSEQVQPALGTGAWWELWAPRVVLAFICVLLALDRWRYLRTFGFVYTDGDQATFWYQAWDVSRGIFREPCLYGQTYNVAVEAWTGALLMKYGVPAYGALPVVTVVLALLPFVVLAALAWRGGARWGAVMVLLIPLALPVEYEVVSSLPRGFVNGIAVGMIGAALWVLGESRWAFFFAGVFAVAGVGVNPSCAIVLLAAGVFAGVKQWKAWRFWAFSLAGAAVGALAPLGVWWFYQRHPECDVYQVKVGSGFSWVLLRNSIGSSRLLDMFWGDLVPVVQHGWVMFVVFGVMVGALVGLRTWRAAIAVLMVAIMTVAVLGEERLHTAWTNVFYSGSRMFLGVPVVWALGLWWVDEGMGRRRGAWTAAARGAVIGGLCVCAWCRHVERLNSPSMFVTQAQVPPVDRVGDLQRDTAAVAAACEKYHVTLVLVSPSAWTSFGDAGPVLSGGAFETLSPAFERRSFRVAEERVRKHTAVLVYLPGLKETMFSMGAFPGSRMVSRLPALLLVPIPGEGKSGVQVAEGLGMTVRLKI